MTRRVLEEFMCDHANKVGGREAAMSIVKRGEDGVPTVWCDPCLTEFVTALNAAGLKTVASCCGHGKNDSSVALEDGRWLTITYEPPVAYEFRSERD